jgi:hypothetical protein
MLRTQKIYRRKVRLREIALWTALALFPLLSAAQDIPYGSLATADDSLALMVDAESYFTVTRLRLIRLLRKSSDSAPVDALGQAVDLLEQADKFAAQKDYETAQLILETAFDVAKLAAPPALELAGKMTSKDLPQATTTGWRWTREAVAGVDYWEQEFELGFSDQDSVYSVKSGNPFTGLRLNVSKGDELKSFFSAYALLKTSRDYNSGEVEVRARRLFADKSSGRVMNRLEGTSYKRDLDLQYWQNTSMLGFALSPTRNLRIDFEDELRYRGYRRESEFYPNYMHNQIRLGGSYLGLSTRIDASYDYAVRLHPTFAENNYVEHRVDASIYQETAANSSIYLQNLWRFRDYARGFSDTTYQNTYQEEYLRGDFRIGLGPKVAVRVEGDYTLRQYEVPSSNTPDFSNTYLNPQLVFKVFGDWQVGLGYMYLLRVHAKDLVQKRNTPVTDARGAQDDSVPYEDYYSNGLTVSLELFRISGLMLSVNHTYEMRKYPNSTTNQLRGWGFYTDRNINTLLLFFSMNLSPCLQLSALANLDDDRSLIENQSDSQSTLFSIDLGYSF